MSNKRITFEEIHANLATNDPFGITDYSYRTAATWAPNKSSRKRTLIIFVESPHQSENAILTCAHIRGVYEGKPILVLGIENLEEFSSTRKDGEAIVNAAVSYALSRIDPARRCRKTHTKYKAASLLHIHLEAARLAHEIYKLGGKVTVPIYSDVAPDLWGIVKEAAEMDNFRRASPPREPTDADVEALSALAPQ